MAGPSDRGGVTSLLTAGLVALSADVARGGRVANLEGSRCRRPTPAPRWAGAASLLGDGRLVLLALGAVAASRGVDVRRAVAPVLAVACAVTGRRALSEVVRRQRPPQEWWQEMPEGWSYPSRHTANAMLFAYLLTGAGSAREGWRVGVQATAPVMVGVLVGASRVRLGVHWPTDVLGSILLFTVWRRLVRHAVNGCEPFQTQE